MSTNYDVRSFYFRLIASIFMFSFGLATLYTCQTPIDLTGKNNENKTLPIFDFNSTFPQQTQSPNSSTALIAELRYIPASLTSLGSSTLFWSSLTILATGGAYLFIQVKEIEERMKFASKDYAEYSQKLWDAPFREIENNVGVKDRFIAGLFMGSAVCFGIVAGFLGVVDDLTSSEVPKHLLLGIQGMGDAGVNGTVNVPVIGGLKEHGTFSLQEWTCQWTPILPDGDGKKDFVKFCSKSTTSRYLFLVALIFSCLSLYTVIRPQILDIDFANHLSQLKTFLPRPTRWIGEGRVRRSGGWNPVPLESEDDNGEDVQMQSPITSL